MVFFRVGVARNPGGAGDRGPCCRRSGGRLGEEISGQECPSDAGVKLRVAVVNGIDDRILKATRIVELQMEGAIFGVVLDAGPGADVRLEGVEAQGHNSAILRDRCADGTSWTAISGRGEARDSDQIWIKCLPSVEL